MALRQAALTQDANYVSTSTLIVLRPHNSVGPLLIYGFVDVVKKVDYLPELSDVGVRRDASQEPKKLWGAKLYDRRYESHEPLERERKRSDSVVSSLR